VEVWQGALGIEPVGIYDNFFELGGDSIIMIQIVARARRLGLRITPRQMGEHQTVAELAEVISQEELATATAHIGPAPLLPIQRRFFETDQNDVDHFNQAMIFRSKRLDAGLLETALDAIIARHDALRSRFERSEEGEWRQIYGIKPPSGIMRMLDLSDHSEEARQEQMALAFSACQCELEIASGRLMRALLVRLPDEEDALLITIHHLVVDGVSWRILHEDLERAYHQLETDGAVSLPSATTSPALWAQRLESFAQAPATKELDFWQHQNVGADPPDQEQCETNAQVTIHSLSLNVEETACLLRDVPKAFGTEINDVLLAALARAMAEHLDRKQVLIDLEGHGREDIFAEMDLSQSVGWFTTIYPVLLTVDPADPVETTIASVRRQLRTIPRRGIAYGALRYLSKDPNIRNMLAAQSKPLASFNYLGQFQKIHNTNAIFQIADDDPGPLVSSSRRRFNSLEFNAVVKADEMKLFVIGETDLIANLLQNFVTNLREIIVRAEQSRNRKTTKHNITAALTDQQLMEILKKVGN
jgi:non-ribosomal peptide synthase protein (TIGR01720 family)